MKKYSLILCSIAIFTLSFMNCTDKERFSGGDDDKINKDKIFSFSTKQNVQLNIVYDVPNDFQPYVEVYSEDPVYLDQHKNYVKKAGLEPIFEGYLNKSGSANINLNVATASSEIYIYSPSIGIPTKVSASITNGKVNLLSPSEAKSKAFSSRSASDDYYNWPEQFTIYQKIYHWDAKGTPQNLIDERFSIDKKTLDIINATIPEKQNLDIRYSALDEIELSETARVKLHYVWSKSGERANALAYYTYSGTQPTQKEINESLKMLFPNLSSNALQSGDGLYLLNKDGGQIFSAHTKIGFVLLVDAWERNGDVNNEAQVVYSNRIFNQYAFNINGATYTKDNNPHMALFSANGYTILTFEDQPWINVESSQYYGDFRDNVFLLQTDPATALPSVEPGKDATEPEGTLRGSLRGTLAFEDVWPYKGDYDMNDIVLSYKSAFYLDQNYNVTAVVDTFEFLNNGAKYSNAFGYELPTDRSNISNIDITADYQCAGQGLDASLNRATIMLFDDGKRVNTGSKFIVKVIFKQPISLFDRTYTPAPYNPFIVIDGFLGNNRKEVHLVNYTPTEKADKALFSYGHDLSNPQTGIYYVSNAQYPFAINMCTLNYNIPTEGKNISFTYPRFDNWVTSKGTLDKDWYNYPNK